MSVSYGKSKPSLGISADNRHVASSQRKSFSIHEEVLGVYSYLYSSTADRLQDLNREWVENHTTPYLVNREKLNRIIAIIKDEILDIYFRYEWKTDKVSDVFCSFTGMSKDDISRLTSLWWCYRELKIIYRRIYINKENYMENDDTGITWLQF